jgi:hypothetical protein
VKPVGGHGQIEDGNVDPEGDEGTPSTYQAKYAQTPPRYGTKFKLKVVFTYNI